MSKNKQILIFSGIGLAVLGGVAALLLLTAPAPQVNEEEENTVETVDTSVVLTDKTEADVLSLHIKNAEGEYDIVNSGKTDDEGKIVWTVKGLESAELLTSSLSAAVENAAALTAKQLVEENAEDLEKYGLSEPKANVTVNYTDGTSYEFAYGSEAPTSSSLVYFYGNDKSTVYTYTKSKLTAFSGNRFSFVSTAAMPGIDNNGGEEIVSFRIERFDLEEPIVIEQIPSPDDPDELAVFTYQLTSPYTAYIDLTDAPAFMYSLFGLTASSVEWYGMDETDYAIAGLDDPTCVFTLETTVKTYTITLGGAVARGTDEDGNALSSSNALSQITGFYGISSEVPDTLFVFDLSSLPAISIKPEGLISKLFLMPYIYSLKEVRYEDCKGHSFTMGFEKIKEAQDGKSAEYLHKLNGEEYTEQLIKNMYQYLIGASGDDAYFDEEKGEQLAEVHYVYTDPSRGVNGEDVVRFYSSPDDRKAIVSVNGKNIFKLKQIYVTQLYQNAESFLNGGDIVLTY